MKAIKKTVAVILIVVLSMTVLAACGGTNGGSGGGDSKELTIKTLGDAFDATEDGTMQWSFWSEKFVYVFEHGGVSYRAVADLTPEQYAKLEEVDIMAEDSDEKIKKAAYDVEVTVFENLTEMMPGEEELKQYVGKTGQELFDNGWYYWFYNLEDMSAGLNYGPFNYTVVFDYDGPQLENTDDFDFYEEFKDLTIKSITCDGIGDAANID